MKASRKKTSFGFLICGMVIGLSLGIVRAKLAHDISLMIVGPIIGALAGAFLEAWATRRNQDRPPVQNPDAPRDSK